MGEADDSIFGDVRRRLDQRRAASSEHHAVRHADGLMLSHLPLADGAERARHQRNLASPAQMPGDTVALEDKIAARQSHLGNEPLPASGPLARHRAAALGRIHRRIKGVRRTRRRRLRRLPTRSLLIDAEDAPGERRRDNPLALIGQPIETGQQRLIDLLTRVSQISQRLAAIEPRIRHAPCAKTSIAHHHETSATFNAHEAARAISGLFMVYTCSPSTPCACKSVSWRHAYSMPA